MERTPPWWVSRPYRDMGMRRLQLEIAEREQFLERRRLWIRDPVQCLGASLAIAGAAAISRMTLHSLDWAFRALAAQES